MTARIRVFLQSFDEVNDLVEVTAVMGWPGAPLIAVDRPEVTVGIGPFVPDMDAVFLQIGNIGIALQEPEQLMDDGFQMQLLGGQHREAVGQIKTHLIAEDRACPGAGAIATVRARLHHMTQEVEILFHEGPPPIRFAVK